MITVVWLLFATVTVLVAGSKLEATEGQHFSIPFKTELERVDKVTISFEGENQTKQLIARSCSGDSDLSCKPVKTDGVSLQVEEGNVALILQHVNISRSGLYKALAFSGKKVCEANVTLVVNKASFSSTIAPTHTPKPLNPSEHQGLYALIPLVIIVILGVVCFCKLRRKGESAADGEGSRETVLLSSDPVSPKERNGKNDCGDCVVVDMNGCGEDPEALLASENT